MNTSNKCKNKNCGCQKGLTTQCSNLPICPNPQPCDYVTDAQCVIYSGETVMCDSQVALESGSSLSTVLQDIYSKFCDITFGDNIQGLFQSKFTLTFEQLRNAWSTPILLIPSPGQNKYIEIVSGSEKYNFQTETYKFAGPSASTGLIYNNSFFSANDVAFYFGNINASSSYHKRGQVYDGNNVYNNRGIAYKVIDPSVVGDSLEGDGTITIYLLYRIVNL